MKVGRKNSNLAFGLAMIILFMGYYLYAPELSILTEYISLLPSLLLITVSVYGIRTTHGPTTIGGFAVLGTGLALLTSQLYDFNVIIPALLSPTLTLPYLQVIIIIFSIIIGAALAD